jgi:uncharacterized damage-inducible protein DinB
MLDSNYCQTMADYNSWMNQKLYTICAGISDVERKRDRGAFFKSIHSTLNHLLYGDRAWIGRFTKNPFCVKVMGQELFSDFDELRQEREVTDREIVEWSKHVSNGWLEAPFEYTSNVDRKTRILPTWVLVVHMFNHQTHHRGQLTTLLSQVGYDPGVTDLPWLPSLNVT